MSFGKLKNFKDYKLLSSTSHHNLGAPVSESRLTTMSAFWGRRRVHQIRRNPFFPPRRIGLIDPGVRSFLCTKVFTISNGYAYGVKLSAYSSPLTHSPAGTPCPEASPSRSSSSDHHRSAGKTVPDSDPSG